MSKLPDHMEPYYWVVECKLDDGTWEMNAKYVPSKALPKYMLLDDLHRMNPGEEIRIVVKKSVVDGNIDFELEALDEYVL